MRLFLSYSRDDKAYVYELWRALRDRAHHDAWIDQRIVPAQDWWETILKSIETCETFIYLMTPKSVESIYCRAELAYALALNKPILPIMVKPCDYPQDLKTRRIQYSTINDGDSLGDVLFVISQALGEIRVQLVQNEYPPPTPLPVRPNEPKPESKPEQVSEVFLLAEEAASENNFSLAEKLFQQVIDADPQSFGPAAAERLGEIRPERSRNADYLTIVQMVSNPALRKGAAALWRVYVQKYGTDYDPNGIAGQFTAQVIAPQSSNNVQAAPLPPISKPIKTRVLEFLPPPFAWIDIPAGKVTLEKGGYLKEHTTISVGAFTVAKYPVTNAQYQVFINAPDGYIDPQWWDYSPDARQWRKANPERHARVFIGSDYPRANLTWYECIAFTSWLSIKTGETIRLLTEAEWQRAAQGDDNRTFPWGSEWNAARCNNCLDEQSLKTTPVSRFEGIGDSPYGVVDLSGNVPEWTATNWSTGDADLLTRGLRLLRSCWWTDNEPRNYKVTYRSAAIPDIGGSGIGFRLARS